MDYYKKKNTFIKAGKTKEEEEHNFTIIPEESDNSIF